jgi:hypothetical protein
MNKITITILLFLFIFIVFSHAGADTKYGGSFLELGIGARAIALGGAYTAVADNGSAFYWNPAGVSMLVRQELFGMYASLYKSLSTHHHIGYTRPLYGGAALSLNWIRLTVSDIPLYDVDPEKLKLGYSNRVNDASTSAESWQELKNLNIVFTDDPLGYSNFTNDAFFLTLAKLYKVDVDFGWQYFVLPVQIPVGLNIKFIRESLFNHSASGIGFDAGSMIKFGFDDLFDDNRLGKFGIGFAMKDILNTKLTWNTDSRQLDRIKRSWHFGLSYMQPIPAINGKILTAWSLVSRYERKHHFGLEYDYYDRLALRFGLDEGQFTAGVGLKVLIFHIDYAYMGHELGGSHRVSTSVRF